MREKGIALTAVLGFLVVTSIIMGAFLGLSGVQMRMAKQFSEQLQAHYLARAGVETAISRVASGRSSGSYSGALADYGKYEVAWKEEDDSPNSFTIAATGALTGMRQTKVQSEIRAGLRKEGDAIFIMSWDE